jgi:hypothetical protein
VCGRLPVIQHTEPYSVLDLSNHYPADYLIIPIIALIMGNANAWGYFKCSREAKDQLSSMTSNIMTSAATSYMSNAFKGGAESEGAAAGSARV